MQIQWPPGAFFSAKFHQAVDEIYWWVTNTGSQDQRMDFSCIRVNQNMSLALSWPFWHLRLYSSEVEVGVYSMIIISTIITSRHTVINVIFEGSQSHASLISPSFLLRCLNSFQSGGSFSQLTLEKKLLPLDILPSNHGPCFCIHTWQNSQ